MPVTCPASNDLLAYLQGRLPLQELEALTAHLEGCPDCQRSAEALEAVTDPLLADLRGLAGLGADSPDPALQYLLSLARAVGATGGANGALREAADLDAPERIGDYLLLKKLGHGGFGTVYLARGLLLQRLVAVKVLREAYRADAEVKGRFLQELRAAGQLRPHPNVVQAHHAAEEQGLLYLVMEYIEGTDLARLVRQRRRLPAAEACEVCRQAALGLQHIHEHGQVHRDVKPANLMLDRAGVVKVMDLGLARLAEGRPAGERATALGQVMGTLDYIAPEQARDAGGVDVRADVYSLGCTLYHLLTGQVPFPAGSVLEKLEAHQRREPAPLAAHCPDLPDGLQNIVSRMMAKDPAARHATPAEVAQALQPFCTAGRLEAPPALEAPPEGDPGRRRETSTIGLPGPGGTWRRAGVVAAGLVAAAAVALGGWYFRRPASVPPPEEPATVLLGAVDAYALAFAPDGRRAVSEDGSRLHYWDLDSPGELLVWRHGPEGFRHSSVAFTPDGQSVFLATNESFDRSRLRRYAVRTGLPAGKGIEHRAGINTVAVSADGGRVLAGDATGMVRVWDGELSRVLVHLAHPATVWGASFSADGALVATGCDDGALRVWSVAEPQKPLAVRSCHQACPGSLVAVTFASDGKRVCCAALADRTLRVWNWQPDEPVLSLATTPERYLMCAAFAADGRRALTGHEDGTVVLWDLEKRQPQARYRQHGARVQSVALSADGRRALSAGEAATWLYRFPAVPRR